MNKNAIVCILISMFPFALCARRSNLKSHDARSRHRARPPHPARRLEPSRPRRLHGRLLELSRPDLLLRRQRNRRMASHPRSLQSHLRQPRPRNGHFGFLQLAHRDARPRSRLRPRRLASDHVRRQNSPRPLHANLPQISRRVEDHPRPHLRRQTSGHSTATCHP